MTIRSARPADLPFLQAIERAAGELFRELGMPEIAEDEPPSLSLLQEYAEDGRCWVVTTPETTRHEYNNNNNGDGDGDGDGDYPVAYLLANCVDGTAHIEQVSVTPSAARRGLGAALIDHLAVWAMAQGLGSLTLTTFAEVPWNAPYYERIGFRVLKAAEVGKELHDIRVKEREKGLDRWPRVCMRRDLHYR
ncbi:hypothetical protein AJ78_09026 [Emergomyces pasteurianus Ep9510]|uniref:N-acetyltransferase domain-containing protein n=1 Tax=Emergomyces pasteurianus Ep9510 TaxID=1447872 RepID=A0A1J9PZZ2_9EURO|nr:hypothetical protein AJ78_09026 [Emergomyces pasteurianus Ep9510]